MRAAVEGLRSREAASELRVSEQKREILPKKERQMWKTSSALGQRI